MPDLYEQVWNPQDYLKQYYSGDDVTDDEKANFEFIIKGLKQSQRQFERCIDVGCGCTIHHVIPSVSYVREIHLADYLPGNLAELEKWVEARPGAHNWDVYVRGALEIETEQQVAARDISLRQQALREKITALKAVNIRNAHPLGDASSYDLVLSFYCAEAVASSKAEWHSLMENLCRLISPGGMLILTAMRRCRSYQVIDQQFPAIAIDETDLETMLMKNDFDPARSDIQVVQTSAWSEQGFDGICMIKAEKMKAA
jgi:SAM-dependent methyltransferase